MDIYRLDPNTYLPNALLEGYSSMIWTERHVGRGDFELKTAEVFPTMEFLPEGTLLGLRDSPEIMVVETRSISVDAEGLSELTIVGKTFETFLENRILLAAVYNTPWLTTKAYTPSEVVELLLWTYLVNTTGEDPSRPAWVIDNKTGLPNVVVTDSTTISETPQQWWFEEGAVYPLFQDLMILGDVGIRNIRPNNTTGDIIRFDTSRTAARGNVIKTTTSNISQIRLDVYNGTDRSRLQSSREPVMFHYDSGHIDNPSYLFSTTDYKTMATISASFGSVNVYPPSVRERNANATGFDRRVLFIDGGDIGDQDYNTFVNSLVQKALIELKKHSKVRLFDGAISPVSPYEFRKDYFLGDYVTLLARFGFDQTMRVSEYVRTEDAEGDRGYPGLSSLAD
jgi:Siphovirus ReqiPepy6 Gp37-like protein